MSWIVGLSGKKISVKRRTLAAIVVAGAALAFLIGAFFLSTMRLRRPAAGLAAGGGSEAQDSAHGPSFGSLIDDFSPDGMTPLMNAARENDVIAIAGLVRAGAAVDRIDHRQGWTPLLHAIHKSATAAVAALLAAGADPNFGGAGEVPPLFFAVMNGDAPVARLLLDRGADPRARLADGTNALLLAVEGGFLADVDRGGNLFGSCQDELVSLLLERAPELRLPGGFESRLAVGLARLHRCKTTLELLAAREKRATGS